MNINTQHPVTWCAIGDSFTYLDSHLDETGYRLHKGYLTRTLEQLPEGVRLINLGVNGTILGNLRLLIECIRGVSPDAPVFVMNPVERGEFVYLFDHENHAHGSDRPENGLWLEDVARAIFTCVRGRNIFPIDLHTRCDFTPENAVRFKRVLQSGEIKDLPYEDYRNLPEFNPKTDPYPYPEEAVFMTYDGLHPSDEGSQIIADILSSEIRQRYPF